jgi:hypothetical protein
MRPFVTRHPVKRSSKEWISVLMERVDATQATIGREAVIVVGDLLESLGLWLFTAQLGWTASQFDHLMREVRVELGNDELNLYLPM